MAKQLSDFRAWLETQGYRLATARQSDSDLRLALRLWQAGKPLRERHATVLRRYRSYLDALGEVEDREFAAWVRQSYEPAAPLKRGTRGRLKEAVSFGGDDWDRLRAALAEDPHPEARVLEVQSVTGLRVGDVLRIEREELEQALAEDRALRLEVKGGRKLAVPLDGARDVWEKLLRDWKGRGTLADWVAPRGTESGRGAYHAVYEYLRTLGRELGLHGRAHPHRLRRTVATRALRLTGNLRLVQDLLGHRDLKSTQMYVDEQKQDEVAALQRRLRKTSVEGDWERSQ